jgi:phthalate 4,5-dioxygenase
MITQDEINLLTRVGPGTPMGEMLRRYWVPAMLADELPDPDGTPKAIRLLGEDLVAFRDTQGRIGIMDIHCPHRLSSLALGRNEEGGIRCLYHGWKIDINGKILETPCELPTSRMKDHITHRAYPTREAGDLIWVYMGAAGTEPAFPDFNWISAPKTHRSIGKMWESCNFIQSLEGVLDSFHANVLHSGTQIMGWTEEQISATWTRPSRASYGRIGFEDTEYGYRYASIREGDGEYAGKDYIRITEYVAPFYAMNPPDLGRSSKPFIFVPIDDENTMLYEVRVSEAEIEQGMVFEGRDLLKDGVDHEEHLRRSTMRVGIDLDERYRPFRNASNNYGQDRELMRRRDNARTSYSGIDGGVQNQDLAMIETMGAISDRTKEHLAASDLGVLHWRERMIGAVRSFAEGAVPLGLADEIPYRSIRSVSAVVPKGSSWQAIAWDAAKAVPVPSDNLAVL